GTGTSALVRRGVLLLGVMLELLALLLETVHQIRQTGTDERAPVITVRVVVRTDPLHGVHHSAHVTDDLHDLLTRLGHRGRDLATLIRIHTLESHDLPLSPHSGAAQMKIEETQEPTIRTTTRRAASSRTPCPARRTHHTSASPAARAPASPRRTHPRNDHGPHPTSRSPPHDQPHCLTLLEHSRWTPGSAGSSDRRPQGSYPSSWCPPCRSETSSPPPERNSAVTDCLLVPDP